VKSELVLAVEDAADAEASSPPEAVVFFDGKHPRFERHAPPGGSDRETEPSTGAQLSFASWDERVPGSVVLGGGEDPPDSRSRCGDVDGVLDRLHLVKSF
jgi:hypothetical protein